MSNVITSNNSCNTTYNNSCNCNSNKGCCVTNMTVVGNTLILQQENCEDVSVQLSDFAKSSLLKIAQCKIDEN